MKSRKVKVKNLDGTITKKDVTGGKLGKLFTVEDEEGNKIKKTAREWCDYIRKEYNSSLGVSKIKHRVATWPERGATLHDIIFHPENVPFRSKKEDSGHDPVSYKSFEKAFKSFCL